MTQDGPGDGDVRAPVPSAPTEGLPEGLLAPGQVLGDRYQIKSQLGRGGMGEVWRAFDLKLRVEVALKAMLPDLFKDERRRDLLRREVRAAREVVSPNVCRIFDLIEVDGRELVSMEYVDGGTLLGVLHERGPLDLKEAQDIASQFLAGLEAIHQAGLVHRDVKPENIMITRAGRVVLMDFGLARQEDSGAGTVSGTPAYMAPEQAMGGKVDARADVYSAGVVLAEMVSPEGIKDLQSRKSVWEGIRHEPARVPDTPWAPVLKKAVAKEPDNRHNSAHTLIRELEDVTLRVEGAEDLTPYPGLASFTEEDAEYFFGREAEVEQMWRRLEGPPRLSAIVGPSGAGKTSFLRAGLAPSAGAEWGIVRTTPGDTAFASLRQALAAELAGDAEAIQELVRADESEALLAAVGRWRKRFPRALVIIDQFEELFTLNSHEIQAGFAEMVARLPLDAETFVLLSMRDDFLMGCNPYEGLRPVFADLMALDPPTGANLRRALVQPAMKCGYRFEDDELVDEMLAEVEGERGALPLLAFAMSRLWEKRDRDNGLLTRQAYQDIGGVGGALARHAEAIIDRIGVERLPIVREFFRNLVTAEGTRAVREWNELLSVFDTADVGRAGVKPAPTREIAASEKRIVGAGFIPARDVAEEVLRELIDARLLTSYEVREEDEEPRTRVEIIHESLLANWPRLVGWQTQDADSVRLRDELRQAARTWDEHDRTADFLWAGKGYREFSVWRENYPGGLSELEEDFSASMTAHAKRRKNRRRIAVAAVFAVLLAGLVVVGSFWQKSVREALRAEAATLLSQAQLELESNPSATLAYATASLELSDSPEARRLALEALWQGPTAFVVNEAQSWEIAFSPDGQWLVQATDAPPHRLHLIGANGSDDLLDDVHNNRVGVRMGSESGVFATVPWGGTVEPWALWSAPEKRLLSKGHSGYPVNTWKVFPDLRRRRSMLIVLEGDQFFVDALGFDGTLERLGALPFDLRPGAICSDAPSGKWTAYSDGQGVYVIGFGDHDLSEPRHLDHIVGPVVDIECDPLGRFVAARHEDGNIRLWDLEGDSSPRIIQGPSEFGRYGISADGSMLRAINRKDELEIWIWSIVTADPVLLRHTKLGKEGATGWWTFNPIDRQIISILNPDPKTRLWPLNAPADAEPIIMQRGDLGTLFRLAVHPQGQWLATSASNGLTFWPVARPYPTVIKRYEERVWSLAFGPEGRWLATSETSGRGIVRRWRLEGDNLPPAQIVYEAGTHGYGIAVSPDGRRILAGNHSTTVKLLSPDGKDPVDLPGEVRITHSVAFSVEGRFAAAGGLAEGQTTAVIRVWDVASNEQVRMLDIGICDVLPVVHFSGEDSILFSNEHGLKSWDLNTDEIDVLMEGPVGGFAINPDGNRVLFIRLIEGSVGSLLPDGSAELLDLSSGSTTTLLSHGDSVTTVEFDSAGTSVVTGDKPGVIRVGPIDGGEAHVLLGSPNEIYDVAVDPRGRWIASSSGTEIRLWPMPDLSKPPLHTLPRDELIAKLKTLTNLRVVRDEESATGWKLEVGPFPGWETVPTW